MRNVGDRVIAVSHAKEGKVYIFGYGIYKGDFVPDHKGERGTMADTLRDAGCKNPTIELEDGKTVYGCECWWGNVEEAEKNFICDREIVVLDIDKELEEMREKHDRKG